MVRPPKAAGNAAQIRYLQNRQLVAVTANVRAVFALASLAAAIGTLLAARHVQLHCPFDVCDGLDTSPITGYITAALFAITAVVSGRACFITGRAAYILPNTVPIRKRSVSTVADSLLLRAAESPGASPD
jgi:hypothetical protein